MTATTKEVKTFCRVCEPMCGVIAVVEDGHITKLRSNPDHVLSRGHFCKKAMGAVDVNYDPDRIVYPMKRTGGPGEFTRISWEQAYSEIAEKLKTIRDQHGPEALATYLGNPPYYSYSSLIGLAGFNEALGVKWRYGVNAEDGSALLASNELLYGTVAAATKPDIWRTSFLLIEGSNPVATHGSSITEPRIADAIKSVVERGGRVVVVDPRCTETAQKFEYVAIRAGSDAWFLTALIREVIDQGYADKDFVAKNTRGLEELRRELEPCTAEWAEQHTGIPAQTIRDLARDFGSAPSAAMLCRTGTGTQRYGGFSTMLLQMLVLITGNVDKAGGHSFGWGMIDMKQMLNGKKMGATRSRADGLPEIAGQIPSIALIGDITQPGPGQVRALLLHGANPMLQSPAGGPALEAALQQLELHVSIDIYMNETNRLADYILPGATMWEREDIPLMTMAGMMLRSSVYATPAVVEKRGEAKEDWEILYEICRRLGVGAALAPPWMRTLAKFGLTITPRHLADMIIRLSKFGDKYGFKPGGLSFDKLINQHPDGVEMMKDMPLGMFDKMIATPDKRVDLASPQIKSEIKRVLGDQYYLDPAFPLRLHTVREVLTHNSWMHNAASLAKSGRQQFARVHPDDAARYGVVDGADIRIRSPYGEVVVAAQVTDKMSLGNVALPHGWGHFGGWKQANARGGVNSNLLASHDPRDAEPVSASSTLNGIPVNLSPVIADAAT